MRKRPSAARTMALAVGCTTLVLAVSVPAPVTAQAPSGGSGIGVVPADGVVPGSGAGLVLGIIGSPEPGRWERLVRASVEAEALTAAATLIVCDEDAPMSSGGCRDGEVGRPPDVVVDLRPAARTDEACPPPETALIVVDRTDGPCHAIAIGADAGAAGTLLGQALGAAFRTGDRCALDRLLILGATAADPGFGDATGGLRDGFLAACGSLEPDRVSDLPADADGVAGALRAALDGVPPEAQVVILAADDAGALDALAAMEALARPGAVAIGAIGGLQAAWAEVACDPAWLGDVALFPERYGRTIVPAAIAIAAGEEVAPRLATPMQVLDASNIRSIYPDVPAC